MSVAQQPGVPYLGWTLPQFEFWTARALRYLHRTRADYIESTVVSVQAVMSGKARKLMSQLVTELRSADGNRTQDFDPSAAQGPTD